MWITSDHVQLDIATPSLPFGHGGNSPEDLERGGTFVAIADRDLIVSVVAPRNRDIDRTEVRRKLIRFIRNARVEPTAGAVQR
jgi:hypothetical protein